jgi:hypothetical protein
VSEQKFKDGELSDACLDRPQRNRAELIREAILDDIDSASFEIIWLRDAVDSYRERAELLQHGHDAYLIASASHVQDLERQRDEARALADSFKTRAEINARTVREQAEEMAKLERLVEKYRELVTR